MSQKIVWILPSGRMHSTNKTPEAEKRIQDYAEIVPRVIFFVV